MISFVHSALLVLALSPASEAPPLERDRSTLEQNTFSFELRDGQLSGPGAERLREAAAAATMFCVGESHGNVQTPTLLRALLPDLAKAGYGAYAIETGERIANHAESAIQRGLKETLPTLVRMPYTAPFIDRQSEFALLRAAVSQRLDVWGLDQVFLGGARFNLSELVRLAPTPEARALAESSMQRAIEGFLHFAKTRDQSKGFMAATTPEQYQALRDAFQGSSEGLRIIDELEKSARVYGLYGAGKNYESNFERIELMKRHLNENLRQLPVEKKVLLKFGSVHMGRGYSPLNQLDLGNAAAELAAHRGGSSFHLLVTAAQFSSGPSPYAELVEALGDNDWAFIDLRPLREHFHKDSSPIEPGSFRQLVWRYDAVAITKRFAEDPHLPGIPTLPR